MIELHGLTTKQQAFCDIMWALETREAVDAFIQSLPVPDQQQCLSLIELMMYSVIDSVIEDSNNFAEATDVIQAIASK